MKYDEIRIIPSLGNSGAVESIRNNILVLDEVNWPPSALLCKMVRSGKIRFFSKENQVLLEKQFGYYSDLQSIKSEDAISWSLFGNMSNMTYSVQNAFYKEILVSTKLGEDSLVSMRMWQRLPHPENGDSKGPEIDVLIVGEKHYFLVECKWTSGIGEKQGKGKDKDQIQIRKEFISGYGKAIFRGKKGHILFVGNSTLNGIESILWDSFLGFKSIAFKKEFREYLSWKKKYI